MAEFVNFSAESDDDDEDELEKKSANKSSKKASIFGASVLKSSEAATNTEVPKKSEGLDRLLAELSFAKKEQPKESDTVERQTSSQTPETASAESKLPEVPEEFSPELQGEPQSEIVFEEFMEETAEEDDEIASPENPTEPSAEASDDLSGTTPEVDANPAATTTATPTPTPTRTSSTRTGSSGGSTFGTPAPTPSAPSGSGTRPVSPMSVPQAYQAAARANTFSSPNVLQSPPTTVAAANVLPNSTQEADDAAYYARRRGRQEGVLAGALLGGGIEHFRHKRRERKMKKEFAKVEKSHEKNLENLDYEHKRQGMVEELRQAYAERFNKTPESTAVVTATGPESGKTLSDDTKAEQITAATKPEKVQITPEEILEVPRTHHIERSAWHSVELDEHGNPVEDASFAYGSEYYRERAHEIRADDDDDTQPKQTKPQDQKAAATAFITPQPTGPAPAPGGASASSGSNSQQTPSPLPTEVPKRLIRAVTSPPTTPAGTAAWSVALVVIVLIVLIVIM